jgi:hypothetical protein
MEHLRMIVSNVQEFVGAIELIGAEFTDEDQYEPPWFRGAGSEDFPLIPGIYRTQSGRSELADDETRNEFMRRAIPLVSERRPSDDWEWYFLMQHYRAPTRLLDWTDSALIALYFALGSVSVDEPRPAKPIVWVLNPFTLNQKSNMTTPADVKWEEVKPYLPAPYSYKKLPKYPIAIDPPLAAQRLLVQHSHFTIHGHDMRGIDQMQQEVGLARDLRKIIIDDRTQGVDYWRWHLGLLGITETTIFPDLEGLARELRMEYKLDIARPKST